LWHTGPGPGCVARLGGRERDLMTEPNGRPTPDLAPISTEDELRVAVLGLLGDSYDRAVERRTGVSKTTVNDLRNDRRRLTRKTLTLIVEAYDPNRLPDWLATWQRLHPRPGITDQLTESGADESCAAEPGPTDADRALGGTQPLAATSAAAIPRGAGGPEADEPPGWASVPGPAEGVHVAWRTAPDATGAQGTPTAWPARPRRTHPWRPARETVVVALLVGIAASLVTFFVARGDPSAGTRAGLAGIPSSGPVSVALPGPPGGAPPGYGPSGPGGAGPVGGAGPPRVDLSPPDSGAGPVRHGCYSPAPRSGPAVRDQPGAAAAGIHITELRFTYYAAWHPALEVAGRLSAPLPDGWRLVLAAWADPTTRDSTIAHNPGNARYYPGDEVSVTDQRCFDIPPFSLGYGGYPGITTRIYPMLVAKAQTAAFLHAAAAVNGLSDADLTRWGVRVLGYAIVPSRPD